MPLTEKQQAVLRFLWTYTIENNRPPTVREIGQVFGINSPNGVVSHLNALQRKGRIYRDPMTARGIRFVVMA